MFILYTHKNTATIKASFCQVTILAKMGYFQGQKIDHLSSAPTPIGRIIYEHSNCYEY